MAARMEAWCTDELWFLRPRYGLKCEMVKDEQSEESRNHEENEKPKKMNNQKLLYQIVVNVLLNIIWCVSELLSPRKCRHKMIRFPNFWKNNLRNLTIFHRFLKTFQPWNSFNKTLRLRMIPFTSAYRRMTVLRNFKHLSIYKNRWGFW